ncbi:MULTISPECIES: hypothetical protein [unclassified Stenotrophomonas]|uniref:hypothetical protein n=3 Tax=Stenotrophomonas TaxID=40323 RepID=UPI003F9AFB3E
MDLDNREIALLIWGSLIFGTLAWKVRSRLSPVRALSLLAKPPLAYVFGSATLYVLASVSVLSALGWWRWDNLKTTLIWAGGSALLSLYNFQKISTGKAYFKSTMVDAAGLAAVVAFVTASHTFSLATELVIAAALILLSLVVALSDRAEKLRSIHLGGMAIMIVLALLMLGNSIYYSITHLSDFASADTARDFAIPILLTVMFLPFLYCLHLYSVYEGVFASFHFSMKDPTLRRYTAWKLIRELRADTVGLLRWQHHAALFPPQDAAEIDASIAEVRKVRRLSVRPPKVSPRFGWLPHLATTFLDNAGLRTNAYRRTHDGWRASSDYLDLGKAPFPNNIAYYVEGAELTVAKLKLVLNINAPEEAEQAQERFSQFASLLANAAIPGWPLSGQDLDIKINEQPVVMNGYALALKKRTWTGGIPGGYDLAFTIEVEDSVCK